MRSANVALIESLLTRPQRAVLKRLCALLAVPVDRWVTIEPLLALFETFAWWKLGEQLHVAEGVPASTALKQAALILGLKPNTMAKRLRRWIEAAERGRNVPARATRIARLQSVQEESNDRRESA